MNNRIKKTVAAIGLYSALATGVSADSNVFERKNPLVESKMEFIKQQVIEVPTPKIKTVHVEDLLNKGSENKYAIREIKFKETIQYYELKITFFAYSYTFKDQSAVLLINYGEDEKKVQVKLGSEEIFEYSIPDLEISYKLHIKLEELNVKNGYIKVKLMRKKVKGEETNSN